MAERWTNRAQIISHQMMFLFFCFGSKWITLLLLSFLITTSSSFSSSSSSGLFADLNCECECDCDPSMSIFSWLMLVCSKWICWSKLIMCVRYSINLPSIVFYSSLSFYHYSTFLFMKPSIAVTPFCFCDSYFMNP